MIRPHTADTRSTRLVILLIVLSALHAVDFGLTHIQVQRGCFIEANRLAANFINHPLHLGLYKLTLFGVGVTILYACRRHWQAEFGAWLLLGVTGMLMCWWVVFLIYLEHCLANPSAYCPTF